MLRQTGFTLARYSKGYQSKFVSVSQRLASKTKNAEQNSYLKGEASSVTPIFDQDVNTLGELIDAASAVMPHKDLFHHVEAYDKWTYEETRSHINATANGLPEARIGAKKVLAMIQQNDSENFVTRLGAIRAGVVPAHIDIKKFTNETVFKYFDALKPDAVVLTPKYDVEKKVNVINDNIPEIPENWLIGHPLKIQRYPNLKQLFQTHKSKFYDGWYSLKDLFWYDDSPRTLPPASISPSDIAEIHWPRFSNGDDCVPMKFTHESVVQSAMKFGSVAPFADKRVAVVGDFSLPEFQSSMLACIAYGSFIVASSFWFRAINVLKDLEKEKVSVLVTTPSHLNDLVSHPSVNEKKINLETIVVVNTPDDLISSDLIERAKQTFQGSQVDTCFITDGCMAPFLYASNVNDGNVLGKPIPGVEVQIGDGSAAVAIGSSGSLLSKGVHSTSDSASWRQTGINASINQDGHIVKAN